MSILDGAEHNELISIKLTPINIISPEDDKRAYDLRVTVEGGEQVDLIIWKESPAAKIDWEDENWYKLNNVLLKQWSDTIELNATKKTRAERISSDHESTHSGLEQEGSEDQSPLQQPEFTISETLEWLQTESQYSEQVEITKIVEEQSPQTESLELLQPIRTALDTLGIDELYEHQHRALTAARDRSNVVLASDTASGKSLPYQILACEKAITENSTTLYVSPTRSLINDQANKFQDFIQEMDRAGPLSAEVYAGDTPKWRRRQIRQSEPNIVLMTPEIIHRSLLPWNKKLWDWFFRRLDTVIIDEVHEFRGIFGSHMGLVCRRLNRLASSHGSSPQYFCCSATIGNPKEHASNVSNKSVDNFVAIDEDTSGRGARHWLLYNPPYKQRSESTSPPSPEYPDNWGTIRKKVLARDNYTCTKCGIRGGRVSPVTLHAHHILAVGKGGSHEKSNLMTLCSKCHSEEPGHSISTSNPNSVKTTQEVKQERERKSHRPVTLQLFVELVKRGHQTLVFEKTRQGTEERAIAASNRFKKFGEYEIAERIEPYHAALPDEARTEIESGLQTGEIRGIWATSALELGVDIGGLDAVVLSGHPGTTIELFQRSGRAGRGMDDCLVLLVASRNPLDQYCISNPENIFDESPGQATTDPANPAITPDHLLSAADELPLREGDEIHFGAQQRSVISSLTKQKKLERVQDQGQIKWHCEVEDPQYSMDLRGISDREFSLIDQTRDAEISSLSLREALQDCHPNAIHTLQKQKYRVETFDDEEDRILLSEYNGSEFTQALSDESITVEETIKEYQPDSPREAKVGLAEVTYRNQVNEYLVKQNPQDEHPEKRLISQDLPSFELQTEALYMTIPRRIKRRAQKMTRIDHPFLCGIHGVEHLLTSLFPLEILCEKGDIGGLSMTSHPATDQGTIFVYDNISGGVGLSKTGFSRIEDLLNRAYNVVINCNCEQGCPSCIHSSRCRNGNMALHKDLTILMLEWLKIPEERQYI